MGRQKWQAFPKPKRKIDEALKEKIRLHGCFICKAPNPDIDHLVTRGSGGGDLLGNLWPLCRNHHVLRHSMGLRSFIERFKVAHHFEQDAFGVRILFDFNTSSEASK